jgi:protein SCO1
MIQLRKAMQRTQSMMVLCLFIAVPVFAKTYSASGIVLAVDRAHLSLQVSCQAIPGYMDAMVMTIPIRETAALDGLRTGTLIDFVLAVIGDKVYAEKVRIHVYENTAQEPMQARQLEILDAAISDPSRVAPALPIGQPVPDFRLINQRQEKIKLSDFAGKVIALTFIYTKCPLPNFCFRMSNNFGVLHRRFAKRMGKDLVLMTVSFDPIYDQPEVLAEYARTFSKDQTGWHFLAGDLTEVRRLARCFGLNAWQDEGLLTHSLHTVIIGRDGRLLANLEGNDYTARELGDLVESVLR